MSKSRFQLSVVAIVLLVIPAGAAADPPAPAAEVPSSPTWVSVPYRALGETRTYGSDEIEPDDATKAELAKSGRRATGTFRMCLVNRGAVGSARAVRGTGYPAYDEKILREIREWQFRWDAVDDRGRRACADVAVSYPALKSGAGPASRAPAATTPAPAAAATSVRPLGFLLRIGLDSGGDDLANVTRSDGGSHTLTGGGLGTFAAGFFYHPPLPFTVELTIGYKFDEEVGSNGAIKFTRFPFDLVASYASHGHRVGGGVTMHMSPSFECDAAVCGGPISIAMDTAFGFIVQYAYGFSRGSHAADIGVRYTHLRYPIDGESFDGSSFGIFFGAWL